MLDKQGIKEY